MKYTENTYSKGQIWIAQIKRQDDLSNTIKPRPFLILKVKETDYDVVVTPFSTQPPRDSDDVVVEKWQEAGLDRPSINRAFKVATIDRRVLTHCVGKLDEDTMSRIMNISFMI